MLFEPGTAIGRYTVVRHLGRGVTGVVYQATDAGRPVAIKVMLPESAADDAARMRFLREAAALIPLRHRNLVSTFECGVHDGAPYLVMELLAGMNLRDRLRSDEPISVASALDMVIQLCDGLQFTHEHGIVHRDVKPANVWVLPNAGVKLLDFGLARFVGSSLTRAGDVVGSAAYMAPEQLAGAEVDGRADLFAAGVILFELLAGRRPFEGDNIAAVMEAILHEPAPALRTLVPGLSEEVYVAVDTALCKDPANRYSHVADFASDLRLARYLVDTRLIPNRPAASADPRDEESIATGATVLVSSRRTGGNAAGPAPIAPGRPVPGSPEPAADSETVVRSAPRAMDAGAAPSPLAGAASRGQNTPAPAPARDAGRGEHRPGASRPVVDRLRGGSWPRARAGIAAAAIVVGILVIVAATLLRGRNSSAAVDLQSASAAAPLQPQVVKTDPASGTPARTLKVTSQPAGASVIVDGRDTGLRTPAVLPLSGPPPTVVELRAGEKLRQTVRITDGVLARGELDVALAPPRPAPLADGAEGETVPVAERVARATRTATVAVHANGGYPFEMSGCGRTSAMATEHDLEVSAPCTMRLRSAQYFMDVSLPIEASSGRVEVAAPQLAHVQFRSRFEWCTVVLGGRALGSPPVEIDLASGTYRIEVQCPDRSYVIRELVIEPGRSTRRLDDLLH